MESSYYTIGMAGHIDHGKTTLTKALTNVETDRLKEEKERNISIESGYAPLHTQNGIHVSIVDVPGHERFIRQMIAGVAGIDLVVLVIAADEGVMPQTKEHLEILSFLGIEHCIIAVSKIDRVEEELLEIVKEDIAETLEETPFKGAKLLEVDSISGRGVEELKMELFDELKKTKHRDWYGSYRLPIDQVFTVQGQGTVVRGTIYEGVVEKGTQLRILPSNKVVRARSIQVHHEDVEKARAGQRTAINLGGVSKEEVKRGDVLVASDHFLATDTIDIALKLVSDLRYPIKQRMPVKVHVGTSEVMGKIIFFDRNIVESTDQELLCQIRLDEEVVVRRGDRFIVRRPTPAETIGGGWVIEPKGEKYKFGNETVKKLQSKKEGTPEDLILNTLKSRQVATKKQLIQFTSLDETIINESIERGLKEKWLVSMPGEKIVRSQELDKLIDDITNQLTDFHQKYPMRAGKNKAELIQTVKAGYPKELVDFTINKLLEEQQLSSSGPKLRLASFTPHLPSQWKARLGEIISALEKDGLEVKKWETYLEESSVKQEVAGDLDSYLLDTGIAYRLTDEMLIHRSAYERAVQQLKEQTTKEFDLKEAKDMLNVTRKYLIPFLELLDEHKLTRREDGKRVWIED